MTLTRATWGLLEGMSGRRYTLDVTKDETCNEPEIREAEDAAEGAVPARPARPGLRPLSHHACQERRGDAVPRQGPAAAGEGGVRPLQDGRQGRARKGAGQGHRAGAGGWASIRRRRRRSRTCARSSKSDAVDVGALENEVYDHLFSFFRRYYSEGDFLAKRVYKPGVYAIPYEGEEVKLHWANRDQYYIKTSEYLRDYAFRLRPDDDEEARCACISGSWTPPRASTATSRPPRARIASSSSRPADARLHCRGRWRAGSSASSTARRRLPTGRRRCVTARQAAGAEGPARARRQARFWRSADGSLAPWIAELGKPHVTAERREGRLHPARGAPAPLHRAQHLRLLHPQGPRRRSCAGSWTSTSRTRSCTSTTWRTRPRRASSSTCPRSRSSARIAGKIIDFLAQLEDFQKKLWLKKKFVVETQYCITLDRIPEEFYPEIAANDAQREEWVRLFAIDEIKGDSAITGILRSHYSVEFLKGNQQAACRYSILR